jgi:hypothetical protein
MSPEDIRAAAQVHAELGPEFSDAVVASFIDKVDREVAARVEARLASSQPAEPAKRSSRLTLMKGMAIGACAGVLIAVAGLGHTPGSGGISHASRPVPSVPHQVSEPQTVQIGWENMVVPGGGHVIRVIPVFQRIPGPPAPPAG